MSEIETSNHETEPPNHTENPSGTGYRAETGAETATRTGIEHPTVPKSAVHVDDVIPIDVAPGIVRRRLAGTEYARGWLIDFAPGTEWPEVDVHTTEERYYVLSGEVIEGSERHPAGTYVVFAPGSRHRPRSETGARMLGISMTPGSTAR
ncbi:cupin domain-containing protein [Embleya sp. NPDC127516]|uniref:cupin domain-containing protein n=1 Tax=Embleya sp. NPDC127516 TaxID=3363990 RepID=UPI00381FC9CD